MRQGRRRANVVMTKVIQQKMSQLLSSTRLLGLLALPVIMFNAQAEAPAAVKSEAEVTVEAPSVGTSVIDDLAKAPPTATVETQTVVPPAPAAETQTVPPPAAVAEAQTVAPLQRPRLLPHRRWQMRLISRLKCLRP